MISGRNISVVRGSRAIVDDVSVNLSPAAMTVVLGPNGAGKSTLMRILTGAMVPDRGEVEFEGRAMAEWPPEVLARRRAVLVQESLLQFDFSVEEVVMLGRIPHLTGWESQHDREACEQALNAVELGGMRYRRYPTLSGGEKQRVHLARVLAQIDGVADADATRWLFLDEPTSALDLRHQHATLERVNRLSNEHGFGVCAVLHDLNLAMRYADHVILLSEGRVAAEGPPAEVLTAPTISDVYGVDASIHHGEGSLPYVQTSLAEAP